MGGSTVTLRGDQNENGWDWLAAWHCKVDSIARFNEVRNSIASLPEGRAQLTKHPEHWIACIIIPILLLWSSSTCGTARSVGSRKLRNGSETSSMNRSKRG